MPDGALLYRAFHGEIEQHTPLRHPSIRAAIEHSARESLEAWYVVEPVAGPTLREMLDNVKRLPWLQGATLMQELATGLAFAHGRGVVHGNVRPSHIILQRRGRVILGGFDVAIKAFIRTNVAAFEGLDEVNADGGYLAPEVLRLSEPSRQSDLFSLGAVSFEILTGKRPFDGGDAIRQYARSRGAEAPDPWDEASHLPAPLRDLVREMLAASPKNRPDSVANVQARLREILLAESVTDVSGALRSSFARQAAIFPSEDDAGPTTPRPRSARRLVTGELRAPTAPEEGAVAPEQAARTQARASVRRRPTDSMRRTITMDTPPEASEPGDSRQQMDRPRSVALEVLADRGFFDKPTQKAKSATRGLIGLGAVAVLALLFVYLFLLDDPSGSQVVAKDAVQRARTLLPEATDDFAPGGAEDRGSPTMPTVTDRQRLGDAFVAKVRSRLRAGSFASAERLAREALAQTPGIPQLIYLLAEAQFRQGSVDDAMANFRDGDAKAGRRSVNGIIKAAELHEEANNYSAALSLHRQATRKGDDPRSLAGAARALVGLERMADAVEPLRQYVALHPKAFRELALLAEIEVAQGQSAAAIAHYRQALALRPSDGTVRKALIRLGALDEAAGDPLPPRTSREYELEGDLAFKRRRYKRAVSLFRKALETAEVRPPRLVRNLALALQRSGSAREAARAWAAFLTLSPRDADAYFQLGRLLLELRRGGDAKKAFLKAVSVDSRRWESLFELGRIAFANKRWDDAAQRFRAVLGLRPRHEASMHNLGKALMEAGEPQRAATAFVQLGRLRPSDSAPLLTAARLFKMAERSAEAAAALSEGVLSGSA